MAPAIEKLQWTLSTHLIFIMSLEISVANQLLATTLCQAADNNLRSWAMKCGAEILTLMFPWRYAAILYLSMLQSGPWTKWLPKVPFNLIYSMILSWYLIKGEYQITDLSPRPCRVFLSITLVSSQLDRSYHWNTASASVINGIACKESMILAIWDYVINTSRRKKESTPRK